MALVPLDVGFLSPQQRCISPWDLTVARRTADAHGRPLLCILLADLAVQLNLTPQLSAARSPLFLGVAVLSHMCVCVMAQCVAQSLHIYGERKNIPL